MSEFNPRTPDDSSGDQTRFEEIVSSLDQDGGLTAVAEKMATIAEYVAGRRQRFARSARIERMIKMPRCEKFRNVDRQYRGRTQKNKKN